MNSNPRDPIEMHPAEMLYKTKSKKFEEEYQAYMLNRCNHLIERVKVHDVGEKLNDRTIRVDGHGCGACINYRSELIYIPYAKPFTTYYCRALKNCQYNDVEHYQGHGRISIHYPIVYNPDKRLPNCPLNKE